MFVLSGTGEQRFPGLGSLKLYYSCYQLFLLSFFTVKLHSYTVKYTFLNFFYPVEFNRAKKPTLEGSAWTGRLSLSSLSLFSFSELNKAIDANEYNWWRVLVFLPQELQTRSDFSSARNILFARTKSNESLRLLWGLKHVLGANLIPLRTKLVTQTKRVPAWPVINQLCFPERHFSANGISLRLSEVQMKFYERSLQASFPLPLAASPLARAFSRDSLRSPKYPNRRAYSQAMVSQSARPLRKKLKKKNKQTNKKSAKCSNRMALKSLMRSNLTNGSYKPYMNLA